MKESVSKIEWIKKHIIHFIYKLIVKRLIVQDINKLKMKITTASRLKNTHAHTHAHTNE